MFVRRRSFRLGLGRFLILGPDIAAFDVKRSFVTEADECPRPCDIFGIELGRPVGEGFNLAIKLFKSGLQFLGQFAVVVGLLRQFLALGAEEVVFFGFCVGECRGNGDNWPEAARVAVWKIDRRLHPFPALGADFLGLGSKPFFDETIEQIGILEPAAAITFEQIADDDAPCRFVRVGADEDRAAISGGNRGFSEQSPDGCGFSVPALYQQPADFELPLVIISNGKSHEFIEREFVFCVSLSDTGLDSG